MNILTLIFSSLAISNQMLWYKLLGQGLSWSQWNKNRSESKAIHKITDLSQDNTQNIRNYMKNSNRKKNQGVLANLLLRGYWEKKKTSQPLFSLTFKTLLNSNYYAPPYIEKTRVINCAILKLLFISALSFLCHKAPRLDHIRYTSGMFLCFVT